MRERERGREGGKEGGREGERRKGERWGSKDVHCVFKGMFVMKNRSQTERIAGKQCTYTYVYIMYTHMYTYSVYTKCNRLIRTPWIDPFYNP